MSDEAKESIELYKQYDAFFKEELDKALRNRRLHISDLAEFYVLTLLVAGHNKELDEEIIESDTGKDVLAEIFINASVNSNHRALRDVGDRSLVLTGVWWPNLSIKPNNINYYITMGRRSYLAAGESRDSLSELFNELSLKFTAIVNVLAEATSCIYTAGTSNVRIEQMYKAWKKNRNPFLEQRLKSLGISDFR